MPERQLTPSIDARLAALAEVRRRLSTHGPADKKTPIKPAITISREFGCEAFPIAERLSQLMAERTREPWVVMDKALLEAVAKDYQLSEDILHNLGKKPRILDDFFATFTSRWKSDKDYYQFLTSHIYSLATAGNVIIVGRGAAIVAESLKNCYHFRLFASEEFKVKSICRRLKIDRVEALDMIRRKQKERDKFIRSFLDRDPKDLSAYHLVFNNDKNRIDDIAETIASYVVRHLG